MVVHSTNFETNVKEKTYTHLTPKAYLQIHFGIWSFYKIIKTSQLTYAVIDKFDGNVVYQIRFSYI